MNKIVRWQDVMALHEAAIRRAFTFKDKFLIQADQKILKFSNLFHSKRTNQRKKKLLYVGIHIRYDKPGSLKYGLLFKFRSCDETEVAFNLQVFVLESVFVKGEPTLA